MKTPRQIELLLAAAHMLGLEFTTAQAPGAWPNGSRVVKTKMGPGDAHQLGELATVVGSVGPVPYEGRERTYGYFVLWDKPPAENIPVLVHDGRVALAPVRAPEQTMWEGDNCLSREIADVREGKCPDCGAALQEGPHGGLSVNWYCTGTWCGSRFNAHVFGVERISNAMPKRADDCR